MNPNEKDDVAMPRAGGDVIWKGPSHASPAESADQNSSTTSAQEADAETRAACTGDGIFKGASQAEDSK